MSVDLTAGIVRILTSDGGTAGTGFVVADEGLIATCAHVVEAAGTRPDDSVRVVFHATGEERDAHVEPEWWRAPDAEDVAILRLEGPFPEEVKPLPLGSSRGCKGHDFETFGFPRVGPYEESPARGTILGPVRHPGGWDTLLVESEQISPGMSGAPVFDIATRRVIGMVNAFPVWKDRGRLIAGDIYGRHTETNFATLTETLRAVCPALQVSDVCPYRSLDAFTEADAPLFFGRERVVERLVESLRREPRFLAVLGPSGSGKSSLVQAGLIPQLGQGAVPGSDRWGVVVARPANEPFGQLEAAGLTSASEGLSKAVQVWLDRHPEQGRLVMVVDQLEELLVTCAEEQRRAFVAQLTSLLETSLPVTIVLVMRDDFYSRFAQQAHSLLSWLERGLVNVPLTLTRDELRAIIEKPARSVGLTFEAGLIEVILDNALESAPEEEDRLGRSTVLPLLEFSLTQIWERRQDGTLTHRAYGAIGEVTGGLTQWASRAFYELEEDEQDMARRILTSLVYLGDESQGLPDSRRQKTLSELCRNEGEREAVHGVVRRLANSRLLVTGRDLQSGQETVELIHDALLREWSLLREWMRGDRRFLAWRQAIEGRLQAWVESSPDDPARRDARGLLQGRDLAEAGRWLTERRYELSVNERVFIEASIARAKRVRCLWVGIVVFLLLAISVVAWRQRSLRLEAEEQRRIALVRQLAAQAELIRADEGGSWTVAGLLATEAARRQADSVVVRLVVRRLLEHLGRPVARFQHDDGVASAVFTSDGQRVTTVSSEGNIRVWEAATGQEISRLELGSSGHSVVLSPDAQWVAVVGEDGTARVWDVARGREVAQPTYKDSVRSVVFSASGEWVATLAGCTVVVWEANTGQEIVRLTHEEQVQSVTFSPNGRWVATRGEDCAAERVWEVATGKEVARLELEYDTWHWEQPVFSPDGQWVAGVDGAAALVWDLSTGKEVVRLEHPYWVSSVAFSPDGQWIATSGDDDMARVWEVASWRESIRLQHEWCVRWVTFSPDGQRLVTCDCADILRMWEAAEGQEIAQLGYVPWENHMYWWDSVVFSPNGQWLAKKGRWTVWVFEASTGREVARLEHADEVTSVDFSRDARWVVTVSADGAARVWEVARGKAITRLEYDWPVDSVIFSPDGRWVATPDGYTVRVSEATTGKKVAQLSSGLLSNRGALFSPDGRWVVTDGCQEVLVHEKVHFQGTTTLPMIAVLDHSDGNSYGECVGPILFSPNGRWMATAQRNVVRVWDTVNWEQVARVEHDRQVHSVAFSPSARWLASASTGGVSISCMSGEPCPTRIPHPPGGAVRVWEVGSWEARSQVELNGGGYSVVFSPDGRWVAAPDDYGVRVWEVAKGEEVLHFEYEASEDPLRRDRVTSVVLGPDGEWVATSSGDGMVRVWETGLEEEIIRVEHSSMIFSPDWQWMTTTSGSTVRVWKVDTWKEVIRLEHENEVGSIVFSPDWQWMTTTSGSTVRVWKVDTWKEVVRLEHENEVGSIVFSPDWQWVATGSDSTVCVWEMNSGKKIGCLEHDDRVSSVVFSPDGRRVATASGSTILVWSVPGTLADTLCAYLPRNLTQSEWQQYIGDEPYRLTCPNLPVPEELTSP